MTLRCHFVILRPYGRRCPPALSQANFHRSLAAVAAPLALANLAPSLNHARSSSLSADTPKQSCGSPAPYELRSPPPDVVLRGVLALLGAFDDHVDALTLVPPASFGSVVGSLPAMSSSGAPVLPRRSEASLRLLPRRRIAARRHVVVPQAPAVPQRRRNSFEHPPVCTFSIYHTAASRSPSWLPEAPRAEQPLTPSGWACYFTPFESHQTG